MFFWLLFTPVLLHRSSVHRHKRGESIIPRGDRFPLGRDSGPVAETGGVGCALSRQREGALFPVLPGSQEDRRIQAHSGSSMPEPAHCMQEVPYVNYETVTGTGAARRLVHNHRPEGRLLLCRNCSKTQKVFAFCLPGCSLRAQQTVVRLLPIPTHVQPQRSSRCAPMA